MTTSNSSMSLRSAGSRLTPLEIRLNAFGVRSFPLASVLSSAPGSNHTLTGRLNWLNILGSTMQSWNNDPRFWDALDNLVNASWRPLKELLDVLQEYDESLDLQTRAMLIGGLGTFTRTYAIRRSESNGPEMSFESAVGAVHSNPFVQALMGQAAEAMVDAKVDALKGVEQ